MKAAEALPGIIGVIISWLLNRAVDRCSWLGITKSLGIGCRYWRLTLYVHGYQIKIISQCIII